ncbi:hypothetical protein KCP73_23260 [Salmonella enterica subsp. enterica]|nr:hypothetical protein KCP73_23260 [Salmonella enterica subsp. enterica]
MAPVGRLKLVKSGKAMRCSGAMTVYIPPTAEAQAERGAVLPPTRQFAHYVGRAGGQ